MPSIKKVKCAVINHRGRARVARGLPFFNPRRSVGQPLQESSTPISQADAT